MEPSGYNHRKLYARVGLCGKIRMFRIFRLIGRSGLSNVQACWTIALLDVQAFRFCGFTSALPIALPAFRFAFLRRFRVAFLCPLRFSDSLTLFALPSTHHTLKTAQGVDLTKHRLWLLDQALDRLVSSSCTHYCASTDDLSTSSSLRGLTCFKQWQFYSPGGLHA